MSVISPWPSSSLTRPGRTTSTTGATTVSADTDLATAGLARRSAPIACDHRTTGSLSPSSSVSHATGFRAASASRHAARRVVFPKPAGQATRVSLRSDPLRRRSRRRSRRIDCSRTDGGCSFVPTRIACSRTRSPTVARGESLAVQRCPGGPPALPDAATGSTPAHCRTTPSQGTWHLACRMRSPGSIGRKSLPTASVARSVRRRAARFRARPATPHLRTSPAGTPDPCAATSCPVGRGDATDRTPAALRAASSWAG